MGTNSPRNLYVCYASPFHPIQRNRNLLLAFGIPKKWWPQGPREWLPGGPLPLRTPPPSSLRGFWGVELHGTAPMATPSLSPPKAEGTGFGSRCTAPSQRGCCTVWVMPQRSGSVLRDQGRWATRWITEHADLSGLEQGTTYICEIVYAEVCGRARARLGGDVRPHGQCLAPPLPRAGDVRPHGCVDVLALGTSGPGMCRRQGTALAEKSPGVG